MLTSDELYFHAVEQSRRAFKVQLNADCQIARLPCLDQTALATEQRSVLTRTLASEAPRTRGTTLHTDLCTDILHAHSFVLQYYGRGGSRTLLRAPLPQRMLYRGYRTLRIVSRPSLHSITI